MIKTIEIKNPNSEEFYGISEQPSPTCPMIDSVISDLQKAMQDLYMWERDKGDADALANRCDYAEWHIGGIESELEKIRAHVDAIRSWGQEWKDLAKKIRTKTKCMILMSEWRNVSPQVDNPSVCLVIVLGH